MRLNKKSLTKQLNKRLRKNLRKKNRIRKDIGLEYSKQEFEEMIDFYNVIAIKPVSEAISSGRECPFRKYGIDGTYYCRSGRIAKTIGCPYIDNEKISVPKEGNPDLIKDLENDLEDILTSHYLKKLLNTLGGPHMSDEFICKYLPLPED